VHRIGWLGVATGVPPAFLERMGQLGYEPGRTLLVEARHPAGDLTRLPELARELVALKPALMVTGSHQSPAALKQATSSIPIVFRLQSPHRGGARLDDPAIGAAAGDRGD